MVFLGRLYYRDDLLRQVPTARRDELRGRGDADLVASLLAMYSTDSFVWLEGDFALCAYDCDRHTLVAFRDSGGAFPVFYASSADELIVSTSLRRIVIDVGYEELDGDYLSDYLLVQGSIAELPSVHSVYRGISRVLPGWSIVRRGGSDTITPQCHWDWLQQSTKAPLHRTEEAAEPLTELLRDAISQRLVEPTASHLSGGLDSTTVAYMAQDEIEAGAGKGTLHAISLVYERLPVLARETPYVEAALRNRPGLVSHLIVGDDLLDYDSYKDPPDLEEPYPGLWRLGIDRATIQVAVDLEARTLLTGIGGDELFDAQPFYLTNLLRRGRLLRAWCEAQEWADAYRQSCWSVLYPFGVANLFPAWSRVGLGALLHRRSGGLSTANEWVVPTWVRPSFARKWELHSRAIDKIRCIYARSPITAVSYCRSLLTNRVGNALGWALAADHGLLICHPFLDRRVASFALRLQERPPREPGREPGRLKPVVVEAARRLLPETIVSRRSKSHWNEPYYLGLSRNLLRLEAMVKRMPDETLEIFDRERLLDGLRRAALGGTGPRPLQHLNTALSLIRWLLDERKRHTTVLWEERECESFQVSTGA